MKKSKRINNIIVIFIIIICSIVIISNFFKALENKSYLKLNEQNREYIEKMIYELYNPNKKIEKIAYMAGLGDWYLFLYYEDGTEENVLINDTDGDELIKNIVKNGYNEGTVSLNIIKISFFVIVITIIYEIIYLVIKRKVDSNIIYG